jgi:hypothetical protein
MARTPIHPGEILADELAALGVTPTELSRQLAVPPKRMTQIIQGQAGDRRRYGLAPRPLVSDKRAVLA